MSYLFRIKHRITISISVYLLSNQFEISVGTTFNPSSPSFGGFVPVVSRGSVTVNKAVVNMDIASANRKKGRYVKIDVSGTKQLTLCELDVEGSKYLI